MILKKKKSTYSGNVLWSRITRRFKTDQFGVERILPWMIC